MDEASIQKVRSWVELDNTIRQRRERIKGLCDQKKQLEDDIKAYVRRNRLEGVQLNISDGVIKFAEKTTASSITLKYLKQALESYFESQPRSVTVDSLFKHILEHRPTSTSFDMVRNIQGQSAEDS